MLKILRAKLHGIRVTNSDLNYHGSITLDPEQCRIAEIYPLEFVEIWNKNSGHRISTYVIFGEAGSRCCVLNGAAARTCQKDDELIICASEYIKDKKELAKTSPKVLVFNEDNSIKEILAYSLKEKSGNFEFEIIRENL